MSTLFSKNLVTGNINALLSTITICGATHSPAVNYQVVCTVSVNNKAII